MATQARVSAQAPGAPCGEVGGLRVFSAGHTWAFLCVLGFPVTLPSQTLRRRGKLLCFLGQNPMTSEEQEGAKEEEEGSTQGSKWQRESFWVSL